MPIKTSRRSYGCTDRQIKLNILTTNEAVVAVQPLKSPEDIGVIAMCVTKQCDLPSQRLTSASNHARNGSRACQQQQPHGLAMSRRSTPEYLRTIRIRPNRDYGTGEKGFTCLNITDREWAEICTGDTPKTLPTALIVLKAEFVRERVYPRHHQVLHDYRVHFKDGTYDHISITPAMIPPEAGRYWSRSQFRGNNFVTWEKEQ